ncbi:MAG: diacylglycerol kinase family protein [Coriobacteriaceae bacterium]|nr:diacylglycerol kinase family protein [Coriobacteriaceae bacterium]
MKHKTPEATDLERSRSLTASFGYAFQGIFQVITTQRNMRIHLIVAVLAILAALGLQLQALEWVAILILIGLVLAFEMLNTALETLIDLVSPKFHPLAKIIKDVGAGMVLILAITAVIGGSIIYLHALFRLIG